MIGRILTSISLMTAGATLWKYGDNMCFHYEFLCQFNTLSHYAGIGLMILGLILFILAPIRSVLGKIF